MTVREEYALQTFSNIDPGFQNPPAETMEVNSLAQTLGYHDAGNFGFTDPTREFSPGVISQIYVYDRAELDWFTPTFVERFAELNVFIDSPGLDSEGCNGDGSWTYTEDDIVQDIGGAVQNLIWNMCHHVYICGF